MHGGLSVEHRLFGDKPVEPRAQRLHVEVLGQSISRAVDDRGQPIAIDRMQGVDEIGSEIAFPAAPLNFGWKYPIHRMAHDPAGPAIAQLLVCRDAETEFDQAPVEERIPRLDGEGRRSAIGNVKNTAQQSAAQTSQMRGLLRHGHLPVGVRKFGGARGKIRAPRERLIES